jgi:hypothetical protein
MSVLLSTQVYYTLLLHCRFQIDCLFNSWKAFFIIQKDISHIFQNYQKNIIVGWALFCSFLNTADYSCFQWASVSLKKSFRSEISNVHNKLLVYFNRTYVFPPVLVWIFCKNCQKIGYGDKCVFSSARWQQNQHNTVLIFLLCYGLRTRALLNSYRYIVMRLRFGYV